MDGSSERIAVLSAQASDSIEAQARQLGSVSDALGELEQSNLQNSALVEQVAASSTSLTEQAARLREAVRRFRLDAEEASSRAWRPRSAQRPEARRAGPGPVRRDQAIS